MAKCWEQRGCDEAMQAECPHSVQFHDNCPTKCAFARCERPQHELTTDPALVLDPSVDRHAARRDDLPSSGRQSSGRKIVPQERPRPGKAAAQTKKMQSRHACVHREVDGK